jgi:ubiquinone/menaquinone biosynthesis C-methylase UbiE
MSTATPNIGENLTKQQSMQLSFRRKRFQHFLSLLKSIKPSDGKYIRILDIGGTENYWKMVNFQADENIKITLLNLMEIKVENKDIFNSVAGSALDLSEYSDGQFDIVFSNSVIEHVGDYNNQKQMAKEFRRVAKNYYIQTPNHNFFFEPHFRMPFVHFLPKSFRVFLINNFRQKPKNKDRAKKRVDGITLLTIRQMKELFPEAKLYEEKFYGMTKSITMYHFPGFEKK